MLRIASVLSCLFAVILACVVVANAVPLQRRQTASEANCNINRLKISADMPVILNAVNQLSVQLANSSSASNVSTVEAGLHGAQLATNAISDAIFTNQTADPDLRKQFSGNITSALNALQAVQPIDTASNATLTQAMKTLGDVATAGNNVVADCD